MKTHLHKTRSRVARGLLCLASLLGLAQLAQAAPVAEQAKEQAADAKAGQDWVRIHRDPQGKPLALEVAIVRYVPARDVPTQRAKGKVLQASQYVDLVGAIHIADPRYYQQLNQQFRQYDALLYELVAPEGTVVERGQGTSNLNPLGAMQNGMGSMLGVEHQLEQIDYTRPNFVHADFSPEEFRQSMENRDEGFLKLYFHILGQAIAHQSQQAAQGESSDLDIFSALFSKNRPLKLKIAMAKQFESMESMLVGLSGPDGSTLITERNKRALQVLRQQQAAGKRKIGIFYGAGHLPDMHKRLVEEFGLQPISTIWLEAWDLRE